MQILFSLNGLECADFFEFNEWTDYSFPHHCHYAIEAIFVTEGSLTVEKENREYRLYPDDVLVIMPFEIHKFVSEEHSRIFVFQMSPNLISNFDSVFKGKTFENPVCRFPRDDIGNIYRHLKNTSCSQIELNYIFFATMVKFSDKSKLSPLPERNKLFEKVIMYTSLHFEENICLKDVAAVCNVSHVYLSRMFTKKANIPFDDFLNSFRLQKALSLLSNTALPISEICFDCGFGSLRNFNRVFFKTMLCTPSEFRKKQNSL